MRDRHGKEKSGRRGRGARLSDGLSSVGHLIEINGRRSVTVFGCDRILSYGTEEITLSVGKGAVTVWGEELVCVSYCAGCVSVEGKINGVRFRDGVEGGEQNGAR